MNNNYVIGVDFGTDSVRALIVDATNGNEMASSVSNYVRWNGGLYCDPAVNQFRQHPLDYLEGLTTVIRDCLQIAGSSVRNHIKSISIATTGSTPVAVDRHGTPLALLKDYQHNPNAMFILWKDHTAIKEAADINNAAAHHSVDYLRFTGGTYSSEWYWAKLLHILRADSVVRQGCFSWVEHSDWMPFLLTGGSDANRLKRNVCAAGHKALWASEFDGLPPVSFFESVDPLLVPFVQGFGSEVFAANEAAGYLCSEWAKKLGLPENIVVGIGAIDAHMGAVGAKIKPYFLSKVIGTSTCDMMVVPKSKMENVFVEGICGQVDDSIIPGMVGLEAGQSAFGDIYSWFRSVLMWPLKSLVLPENENAKDLVDRLESKILRELDRQAMNLRPEDAQEFAIDWFNGRRTPFADPHLKGMIGGLTLGSTPPKIYRALVEATCFGSRAIVESIEEQQVKIQGIQAIGGIAAKSRFVVQMLANVLNRQVIVCPIEQTVALGAAMFASVVGGVHETLAQAEEVMGKSGEKVVEPEVKFVDFYNKRYERYKQYGKMQENDKG